MPYYYTTQPGGRGSVIDAQTSLPVSNAEISLYAASWSDETGKTKLSPTPAVTVKADQYGRYQFESKGKWGIFIVGTDFFTAPWAVVFTAPGYKPVQVDIYESVAASNCNVVYVAMPRVNPFENR